MRLVVLPLAMGLLLAFASPMATATSHAVDPNPASRQWAEADFVLEQPALGTLDLSGDITIRKYQVSGRDFATSDDMAAYYQALPTAQGKDDFVGDIESAVWDALNRTIQDAFGVEDAGVARPQVDRSTLVAGNANPYEPGVRVAVEALVERPFADLGFGDLTPESVAVAFRAGAVARSDFTLGAQPGYDVSYLIRPPASPSGLVFRDVQADGGIASAEGSSLRARVDNSAGTASVSRVVAFSLVDPAAEAAAPDAESIATAVTISMGGLRAGVASLPLSVDVVSQVGAIDVAKRFPDALPASVSLPFLSADALRDLVRTGAISSADLDSGEEALLDAIRENLQAAAPDAAVSGGFDRADLARGARSATYGATPPVAFRANASGAHPLPEGGENADLALRIGATLEFDIPLFRSESGATTFVLEAPAGAVFTRAEGGSLSADKASASFSVPAGAGPAPGAAVAMRDPDARQYTQEDADEGASFGAVLDLQDVDVSISKALGGDFGNLVGVVEVNARMGVFEVPEEFKGSLPASVELEFITSDAVRLLRERGVITQQMVDDLEKAFRENVTTNLRNALGVPVEIDGGLVDGTLDASKVGEEPTGDVPVELRATASFVKPLSGAAPEGSAALALYSMPQSFKLPSVQGLATTYKVILPPGLAVTDVQVAGGASETGSEGGRDYFVVTPERGQEATATMNVAVTPSFVIAKFWPILLLAVLLVFLLVGTPIALVVMRRRKKAAKQK